MAFYGWNDLYNFYNSKTPDKQLNVLSTNIRSLRKYWDSLLAYINPVIKHIDLLVLSEINLADEEASLYGIDGYRSMYKCRPNGRGGGIYVLCKNELQPEILCLELNLNSAEFMFFQINCAGEKLLFVVCYRPPNMNVNQFNVDLEIVMTNEIVKSQTNVIFLGDINLCYLSNVYGSDNYLNVLYTYGLANTINKPTRVEFYNNNLVESCLDHINIKLNNHKYEAYVIEDKIADHYWTGITIDVSKDKPFEINFKEVISTKKVNEAIQLENWWPLLDIDDPVLLYNELVGRFKHIYDTSKITIKLNSDKGKRMSPWITAGIRHLIDHKNYLWRQLKRDKYNINLRKSFKDTRNELTAAIRKVKNDYYVKLLTDNFKNPRKSWSLINQVINKKSRPSVIETIKTNFHIDNVSDINNLANRFNSHYKYAIEDLSRGMNGEPFDINDSLLNGNYKIGNNISMKLHSINEELLYKAVSKINTNCSAGPDNIRPIDIKSNLRYLHLVLIHLIKRIFMAGVIPPQMKITHIRPIFKGGRKQDLNCYRPIGSVSVIMKIIEHFINQQLNEYLKQHDIISKKQYGFIQNKSTIDLLELLTNDINKAINDNKAVVAVTTDLSKAFDLVKYEVLLNKLKDIGIGGSLLSFFVDYFRDRTLCTSIGSIISNSLEQTCGLIQGSIMSPTLFNIYVNDLGYLNIKSDILQYADDNIVYIIHESIDIGMSLIQNDLNLLTKYFFNNGIKLNSNKTKAIVFRSSRMHFNQIQDIHLPLICHNPDCFTHPINCKCVHLQFVNSIKHLGIDLDFNMKYNSHIARLSNNLRVVLFKCRRLGCCFSVTTRRLIYFSLVQSLFYYGITLYYLTPEYILRQLKQILNRILKVLFNGLPLTILGIMSFDSLAKYTDLSRHYFDEEYRLLHNLQYNLRHRQFFTQRNQNNYGKLTLQHKIPHLLNSLPRNLQNMHNKNEVKRELKRYFIDF